MAAEHLGKVAVSASTTFAEEVSKLTLHSTDNSRRLCDFVLENVLLHEAAAQQLQVCCQQATAQNENLPTTNATAVEALHDLWPGRSAACVCAAFWCMLAVVHW